MVKSPQIKLSIKPDMLKRLEHEAKNKSLSISSMARSLLMEKLEEINRGRIDQETPRGNLQ